MEKLATAALSLAYNLAIVGGTAYLVAVYDWSPWWFLAALVIMRADI